MLRPNSEIARRGNPPEQNTDGRGLAQTFTDIFVRVHPCPSVVVRIRPYLLRVSCFGLLALGGCVSDKVGNDTVLTAYQQKLARQGPQARVSMEGEDPAEALGLLQPLEPDQKPFPDLEIMVDPNTGQRKVTLTVEQAIIRALANSPEIRVVSFDPEIARQEITKAAAAFDPVTFGRAFIENRDAPQNSFFESGRAETRLFESGIRQRLVQGTEWSASYALSRNWDDLFGRLIPTRYEPMLVFQLRQPLFRDASPELNLAGVNIARLEHEIALVAFRDRAENVSAQVMAAYWRLVQAHQTLEIQRELVEQTLQTLLKVEGRREIDATDVQLMQALAYTKIREADLLEIEKQVVDVQDALVRLMADPQVNTTSEVTVVPATTLENDTAALGRIRPFPTGASWDEAVATAMLHNPAVQEAKARVQVADINVRLAENQAMPRVDLVASARLQGLAAGSHTAHDQLREGEYPTLGFGVTLEYPLGNRQRSAEHTRRRLERRKAVSILQSAADQIAVQVKERARKVQTTFEQVGLQAQAAQAARTQLKALEESEPIRERLTPEYLLVKLQAQETYAQTRRARVSAIAEFHIAQVELARTTGTVLQLHQIDNALTRIVEELNSGE
jgi:outer membrane protein TolC